MSLLHSEDHELSSLELGESLLESEEGESLLHSEDHELSSEEDEEEESSLEDDEGPQAYLACTYCSTICRSQSLSARL